MRTCRKRWRNTNFLNAEGSERSLRFLGFKVTETESLEMANPILYGADYSVYVRIARMVLAEKGVDHELVPVDVFAAEGVPAWYFDRWSGMSPSSGWRRRHPTRR